MILVERGQTLTSAATEDEVMFMERTDDGILRPAGRNAYTFEILSGSVQVAVGGAVNTTKATAHTTAAAPKFVLTIDNQGYVPNGPQEGNSANLRVVGVGTIDVNW